MTSIKVRNLTAVVINSLTREKVFYLLFALIETAESIRNTIFNIPLIYLYLYHKIYFSVCL